MLGSDRRVTLLGSDRRVTLLLTYSAVIGGVMGGVLGVTLLAAAAGCYRAHKSSKSSKASSYGPLIHPALPPLSRQQVQQASHCESHMAACLQIAHSRLMIQPPQPSLGSKTAASSVAYNCLFVGNGFIATHYLGRK